MKFAVMNRTNLDHIESRSFRAAGHLEVQRSDVRIGEETLRRDRPLQPKLFAVGRTERRDRFGSGLARSLFDMNPSPQGDRSRVLFDRKRQQQCKKETSVHRRLLW